MLFPKPFFQALGTFILLQGTLVSSYPTTKSSASSSYPVSTIHEFSNPAALENIAIRQNGEILVTSGLTSSLYQVSPDTTKKPILVTTIPGASGLQAVVELDPDVFYVIAQNITGLAVEPSTIALWKVDLRQFSITDDQVVSRPAKISLVTRMPTGQLFNGMCRLSPKDNSQLLISDSAAGTVSKLDVRTGEYQTVIADPTMAYLPTGLEVGINGIHVSGTHLFFTNFNQGIFARIPISLKSGTSTGPVEIIVNGTSGDDFILSEDGKKAWLAMWGQNTIAEVDIPEKRVRVIANSTSLEASSAVAFGRTDADRSDLYVTAGNSGSGTGGGRIVRIDLP